MDRPHCDYPPSVHQPHLDVKYPRSKRYNFWPVPSSAWWQTALRSIVSTLLSAKNCRATNSSHCFKIIWLTRARQRDPSRPTKKYPSTLARITQVESTSSREAKIRRRPKRGGRRAKKEGKREADHQ